MLLEKSLWEDVKYYRQDGILGVCDLFLQDETRHIIKLKLYDSKETRIMEIARAIKDKAMFFASRVKLIHLDAMNVLSSTDLIKIAFVLDMTEAHYIRIMLS